MIRLLGTLLFFVFSHGVFAGDKSITVSVYHDGSEIWQRVSNGDQTKLLRKLESELTSLGFDEVATEFCGAKALTNRGCHQITEATTLHLSISLAAIKIGKPKKGLSFSIEMSDPRAPEVGKVDVIPVSCRLSDGTNDRLVGMSRSEEPVKEKYLHDHSLNVDYLVSKLSSAYEPLLFDQNIVALKQSSPGIERVTTEYPDVTIEKITPQETTDTILADDGLSVSKQTGEVEAENSEKKTQYVIHNRGDKLTIEFGHERR